MSLSTNIPLNSRTMSGIILISDGIATLSEGDLTCDDVISNTVVTGNMTTDNLTCKGELRSNTNGPYSIPTATTSITGSLISYGNVPNTGATDITNYGSTYNLLKQGFYFNNINSTTVLTNLAIIDNTQTYFSSPLTGCLAETPLNPTSVVNRSYVDNNFVDRTNNLTQDINGDKTFTNSNLTVFNIATPSLYLRTSLIGTAFSYIRFSGTSFAINNQNSAGTILFQTNANTRATINSTQLLLSSTTFLTTNDMKSRAPADPHSLLSDITTGTLTISSATATNTINGATQLNQQTTFNNFTPFSSVATPTAINHLTRKDYVDNTFVDRVNTLTQNINGLKTFTNNTNFTGTLLSRTNIKLSEYENSPSSNNITLTFPMPETIALRTTASTNNPMTITLPALTNNERGYVFTFNKLFTTFGNFSATFQTSGGNAIYTLVDQITTTTSNTTLLSIDKIQCKLAVGFFGTTNYWVEQTDFSTYDRFKLQEWQNATQTNSLTLTFPLPPTIALRASTQSMMTITLPTLTTNDRGKIFTFLKINTFKFDVTFNTSSSQWIFPLNNLTGSPTTNTSIFPSTKVTTRLVVAWFGTATYWVEISDYSTFDRDENNLIYPRLAIANTFTNTNTFSSSLISNNITAPSSTIAGVNNIYTNLDPINGLGVVNIGTYQNNINILCNLNIVESVYNTTPNKITTINQEGDNCRFTNNGSSGGTYIFTIEESGTFNPLVINQTSVDIAGDAVVEGNLILYDTTPSLKTITTGLVNNDLTFNPDNTVSTTYNFDTNDGVNVTTTPLTISSDSVTINTNITHNQAQLLNKVKVISGTSATLTLPLEQTLMFSSTGATNITITMPELNETYHAGFTFHLIKTGSDTNSVVFNRAGSNLLRGYGSITGATTYTSMINTDTIINVYTLEVSTGNFEWMFY